MDQNYQKRIEKIAQAIYLVSNHLKDSEPLKWELRKESIGFLSCMRSMNENDGTSDLPPDLVVDALSTYARDLVSLLKLGSVSGLISKNNSTIVIQEIDNLIAGLQAGAAVDLVRPGYVLAQDFFSNDPELQRNLGADLTKGHNNIISDMNNGLFNDKIPFPKFDKKSGSQTAQKTKENSRTKEDIIKDKKDSRQMKILTLLRAQSNLTIKDFASVIPDCSEKTIQRELLELVEKGIVKREGERRWSTYSLNK